MSAVTLALVDDHQLFREGLRAMLAREADVRIVAEAGEARTAYEVIRNAKPDVVVLDVVLPGASGISLARELLKHDEQAKILVLTMRTDEEHVGQALEAGVLGYACKDQSSEELLAAIRAVAGGRRYLSPSVSTFVLDDYLRLRRGGAGANSPLHALTRREKEIFELTARGLTNADIAAQLFISKRTVETHRSRMMHKLNLHSALDLVRLAARIGMLPA